MKPKSLLVALLLVTVSTAAIAQNRKPTPSSMTIRFAEVFTSLVVEGNLTVVLTESTSPDIILEGNASTVAAKEADRTLSLSAYNGYAPNETVVYVSAGLLSHVYLNGTGTLRSASTLQNHGLKIVLSDEAKVWVKSTGYVTVETASNIDFVKGR